MTFQANFSGRKKGSLGEIYRIQTLVEAVDADAARARLYDSFEHISNLQLKELPKVEIVVVK